MSLILVAITIALFSSSLFLEVYQINGLNRAVVCTPVSIIETSVLTVSYDEVPMFDKQLVIQRLNEYYDYTLLKFVPKYDAEYYFYNPKDYSFCTDENCSAIEIIITAKMMYEHNYERSMYFEVFKN